MTEKRQNVDRRLIAKELQLQRSSRERTLHFHGESMRPFMVEGDEVVVHPVAWDDIRLGDVITYRFLDRFPTRRVMRKSASSLLLACDNWPGRHFTASRTDVLGRAVARRRGQDWLRCGDLAWKFTRRSAWLRWRFRQLARVDGPRLLWRARGAAGRVLRALGLLPPLPPR